MPEKETKKRSEKSDRPTSEERYSLEEPSSQLSKKQEIAFGIAAGLAVVLGGAITIVLCNASIEHPELLIGFPIIGLVGYTFLNVEMTEETKEYLKVVATGISLIGFGGILAVEVLKLIVKNPDILLFSVPTLVCFGIAYVLFLHNQNSNPNGRF